jgi:RNA polymerase sigma factor (sigma-70 family)
VTPIEYIQHEELLNRLNLAIKDLSEKERPIIVLLYFENLEIPSIANMMNLSEQTIIDVHQKILAQFRIKLDT